MNERDRGALLGMVIGDGCIMVRKRYEPGRSGQTKHVLKISHSIKQKGYLEAKAKRLIQIFGGKCKVSPAVAKVKGVSYPQVVVQKSSKYLEQVRGWCYPNGKHAITQQVLNWMTDEGFAYWFLDDGCISWHYRKDGSVTSGQAILAIMRPQDEADMVVRWIGQKFGIEASANYNKTHGSFVIRFKTQGVIKLVQLIKPYTPECMRYKIEPAGVGHEPPTPSNR